MDDELFKQKLSEVADWEIPITMESTEQGRENRRRKMAAEDQDCYNATYPPKLLKVKIKPQNCEDCGRECPQGRTVDYKVMINKENKRFTKRHCKVCGLHEDPYTGQFSLTGTEASVKWNSYVKPVQRRYSVKTHTTQGREIIYDDPSELITKNPE